MGQWICRHSHRLAHSAYSMLCVKVAESTVSITSIGNEKYPTIRGRKHTNDLRKSDAKRGEERGEALGDGDGVPLDHFQGSEDLRLVDRRSALPTVFRRGGWTSGRTILLRLQVGGLWLS